MHPSTPDKNNVLARRAARFNTPSTNQASAKLSKNAHKRHTESSVPSWDCDYEFEQQIIGTCELLEKCYLRLTSAPKESEVRPKRVLIKSLERVKELWTKDQNYKRSSELLKSIRQDMTVQGIRDELSIEVYETHARLALAAEDHSEFNICQSVLKTLYREVKGVSPHEHEFIAYRILYYLFIRDSADLTSLVMELLPSLKVHKSDCIQHALDVALAWLLGSYHRLFKLYATAPFSSALVMDLFLHRERIIYFKILMKAYRPWIPVTLVTSELGLSDPTKALAFLSALKGVVFTDINQTKIDCKATLENLM